MLCEFCGRREGEQKIIIKDNTQRTVCICRECEKQRLASMLAASAHPYPSQTGYAQTKPAPSQPYTGPAPAHNGFGTAQTHAQAGFTPTPFAREASNTLPFLVCSGCGRTSDEFSQTMLVGCERCYHDLAQVIALTVRRCQPSVLHVGTSPSYVHAARGGEYEYLRTQLKLAVKEERYAEAAEYKRLLDGLKGGK